MDALTALVNAAPLAVLTVVLAWFGKGRFDRLEGQIGEVRAEMRDVRAEMRDMRSEIAGVRSDLTHVALAVGARPRPQTG